MNLWDQATIDGFVAALDELEADPPRGAAAARRGPRRLRRRGRQAVRQHRGRRRRRASCGATCSSCPRRLEALPFPTVFAAHALCLTASFEISLACDLLLAAESAKFGLVERVVGLTPSMGGPQRLVERAGPGAGARARLHRARSTTPRRSSAGTSSTACCPTRASTTRCARSRIDLANGPTLAHAATKRIVRATLDGRRRARPTRSCPRSRARCSTPRTSRAAVASFLENGPGKGHLQRAIDFAAEVWEVLP